MLVILIGCIPIRGQAQMDELSVDQLYEQARTLAFDEGDYQAARKYAYAALDRSPDYHGIRIFVARLYSWEQNYEKAEEELNYVLDKDPENRQALLALVDAQQWSGQLETALKTIDRALAHYPGDTEFRRKKADILYGAENYSQSETIYRSILTDDPGNRKAREGLKSAELQQMKYRATVSYRYDRFRTIFDPWHFTQFGLSRQTAIGSVTGRVEYARRFGSDGAQFNIDSYPSIAKGLYAYVSGGYSQSSIYPDYRFGLSLYKSLPSAFELEAGMRYLDFGSSKTDIYTISLTKYLGSYLFTGRSYLVPSSSGTSKSINITSRRYFGTAEKYVSFNAGYGSAPTQIEFSNDIEALNSWSVGIDAQFPLSERWFLGGNIGYDSAEYPNFVRKRLSMKANVSYRF
ncbi:YaiO family outer membrane beta-barrel protein [Fodinibius sp. Rm-B-1B1-1]|uniref:YaiO family outer membrane beta-barrel protein n=1 Tax=Fodinibius alkaliphilus TaxID=3140241 RepID=UPI00315A651D